MPRAVGTIFGLALAVGAIAFNATSYPIALPTTELCGAAAPAAQSGENVPADETPATHAIPRQPLNQSARPAPSTRTASPAAVNPRGPSPRATEREVQPVADLANPRMDSAPASKRVTQPVDSTAAGKVAPLDGGDSGGRSVVEKPLVPIIRPSSTAPAETPTVRRLPPVDPSQPLPSTTRPANGAVPIYPSTGR
jgi:hypothetical protein